MAKAIKSALLDWLPPRNENAPKKMMDRAYEFYKRVKSAKHRVDNKAKIHEFSRGHGHIHWFLSTSLYSIIQDSKNISKPSKDLFVQPWDIKTETTGEDGEGGIIEDKVKYYLNDDQGNPFNPDTSFMSAIKTKKEAVDVIDDEEDV